MKIPSILFPLFFFFLGTFFESIAGQTYNYIDVNNPVVTTVYGPIRGSKYTLTQSLASNNRPQNLNYIQFIGVPYGAPPTGVNRFKVPREPTVWSPQELDCTGTNRVMCPQVYQRFRYQNSYAIREDEDCLHLNIYVPVDNSRKQLPVLVYIHGGEFRFGGKDFLKPDYLLTAGGQSFSQFIIVTLNYRLGILGFLSTDDYNAPGNLGIWDQELALRWVHSNIGNFGGLPTNVTIMGHDAGGVSVSFHLLNPLADKLFTNAISISGTIFSPWAISDNPKQMARDFAYRFSCGYREDQLVECLRYQDLQQLMSVSAERDWQQNLQPFWFRPVVDRNISGSALLTDFPYNLYRQGSFNRKPYLVITTSQEGTLEYYLQQGYMPTSLDGDVSRQIAFLIRPYLKYYTSETILSQAFEFKYFNKSRRALNIPTNSLSSFQSNPAIISNSQYTLNNQINTGGYSPYGSNSGQHMSAIGYTETDYNRQFCELLGDFLYSGPIDLAARLHSAHAKVQMLVIDYVGQKSIGPLQNNLLQQVSGEIYGSTHFNDLLFEFVNEYDQTSLSGYDLLAAKSITRILSEFILYGFRPLSQLPMYQAQSPNYVVINRQGSIVSSTNNIGFRQSYLDFINDYIYRLQDDAVFFPPYFPQQEYKSYQQATWTLAGILVLLLLIIVILAIVLIVRKRKEHQEEKQYGSSNIRSVQEKEQVKLKHRYDDRSAYISD